MEGRKLLSIVLVVMGLLASPAAALAVGAWERRTVTRRRRTEAIAARIMLAAALCSVLLVSAGIVLTLE